MSNHSIDHYAKLHRTDKASWGHDFTRFYEDKLGYLRDKPIKLLELGVKFGSSIRMWEDAFPLAKVYCVDKAPRWRMKPRRAHYQDLDLSDREAIATYCKEHGPWDVVVDDSAHTSNVTRNVIETFWPAYINPNGWLIIEDINSGFKRDIPPHDQIDYCESLVRNVCHSGMLTRCGPDFWEHSSEFDKAIKEIVYRPGIMGMVRADV